MTNTKLSLLLGTSLSFIPQTLNAQCISPIQDCYALGYTQTSCPSGKGVKCPFGSGWYCGGTAAQDCIKLGYDKDCTNAGESGTGETCNGKYQSCTCDSSYKYTCSGTGYSGGSGTACGGKYTACICTSGYEWKDGICEQKAPDYAGCTVGTLFYSDNTCSDNLENGKSLLGVVIMEKTTSQMGWIMTINPVTTAILWDTGSPYSTGITDQAASASCTNTQKLVALGGRFAAANAANNYNAGGKKWCLPSHDVLNNMSDPTNFTRINAGITTAGGMAIGGYLNGYECIWSSTEGSDMYAFTFYADSFGASYMRYASYKHVLNDLVNVRPVLPF